MLTVIILTQNQEANIRRCLKSVSFADEIIVLDSGSTDNTVAIAKEFTEEVFSTDWPGAGIQKQRALSEAKGDWILNLEADEVVSTQLKEEILEEISEDAIDAYRIPVRLNFYNQILNHSGNPSNPVRLFKREGARYNEEAVNESILLPKGSQVKKLNHPIMHFAYIDIRHALYKINKESSSEAKLRLEKGKHSNLALSATSACWSFFKSFILQRGFLDGKAGFVLSVLNAQNAFYRGIKQIYKDRH